MGFMHNLAVFLLLHLRSTSPPSPRIDVVMMFSSTLHASHSPPVQPPRRSSSTRRSSHFPRSPCLVLHCPVRCITRSCCILINSNRFCPLSSPPVSSLPPSISPSLSPPSRSPSLLSEFRAVHRPPLLSHSPNSLAPLSTISIRRPPLLPSSLALYFLLPFLSSLSS